MLILLCLLPTLMWGQSAALSTLNRMHKVEKGETMYSIARAYNVSVEALENANLDVKEHKIKKGMLLVIPQPPVSVQPTVTIGTVEEKPVRTHFDRLKVGVLLPFEEQSERAPKFVEFYQGLLMAADSVRGEGTQLDIYAWNSTGGATAVQSLVNAGELDGMDVVFGPADAAQLPVVADYCRDKGIRLVLPFTNSLPLQGYPTVYHVTNNHNAVAHDAARLVLDAGADRNFVFLYSNQPDARGSAFVEQVRSLLTERNIASRPLNIDADGFAIESALNQFKRNCIIPDNTSIKTLNILLSKLNAFQQEHPNYLISLQGFPEWQAYTSSLLHDMFTYDTYIYSTYYKNPLAPRVAVFEQSFLKNFNRAMLPSIPQYGMMGFDLGYYFLHGLASLGETFDERQGTMHFNPYQHAFRFERQADGEAFVNRTIQLVHYTPQQKLEIITPK